MHLSDADEFGDMSAMECIRDYMETGGWLCARKTRWRKIEDVSFFGDLATNHPKTQFVTGRVLRHMNLVVLPPFTEESFKLKVN
jgi:hypothetical protein